MLVLISAVHTYRSKLLTHIMLCTLAYVCLAPHVLIGMQNADHDDDTIMPVTYGEQQPLLNQQQNPDTQQEERSPNTKRAGDPKRAGPLLPDDPNRSCGATCALLVAVNVVVGVANLVNYYCPNNLSACSSLQEAILPLNAALGTTDVLTLLGLLGKFMHEKMSTPAQTPTTPNTPATATALIQTNATPAAQGTTPSSTDFMI